MKTQLAALKAKNKRLSTPGFSLVGLNGGIKLVGVQMLCRFTNLLHHGRHDFKLFHLSSTRPTVLCRQGLSECFPIWLHPQKILVHKTTLAALPKALQLHSRDIIPLNQSSGFSSRSSWWSRLLPAKDHAADPVSLWKATFAYLLPGYFRWTQITTYSTPGQW